MPKKFLIFDSDDLKKFHKRIFFSIIVFVSFYFIAIFRIADIMLIEKTVKETANLKEYIERGKIYDRNGQLLATNVKNYSLATNPLKINNKQFLSKQLSEILSLDKAIIEKKFSSEKKFVWLKRNLSPKEHQKIIELGEIHLLTLLETKRIYPFQHIGAHVLGYVDIDNKGQAGVERGLDDTLNKGENIFLTIDINLQNAIQEELESTIEKFSADSGLSLLIDIKHGEIISLNSFPDFNPNKINLSNADGRFNRVLQANYEMGSTFKPITVANGIDKNIINKDMIFDVSKPIKSIHDYHPFAGSLSVKDIIVKSSNIGAAKIAHKIGKKKQIEFFRKIGFFDKINIQIKETAHPLGNKNNWGVLETMTIGFGHGFAVTPLHLATAYASIINEGKKVEPTILLGDKNISTEMVVKKETSEYILKLLKAVVAETVYTGPRVRIEGYEIGGKTGTAELINSFGQYQKNANLTSFIAVFPVSKPQYLVLTIIENPKKIKEENYNITGAAVNAPLVKNIISRMIEILKIPRYQASEILNAAIRTSYQRYYAT
ncbi:penicillin-binding protein 2 [Alphaproteobacteria bacterium]|nr:penicillin-binding protein 2 [Alphaproteobacteria bacterium]